MSFDGLAAFTSVAQIERGAEGSHYEKRRHDFENGNNRSYFHHLYHLSDFSNQYLPRTLPLALQSSHVRIWKFVVCSHLMKRVIVKIKMAPNGFFQLSNKRQFIDRG
jgi:hypothetical protein